VQEKNIDLVVRRGIYTASEFRARYAIHLEAYNKIVNIEARTMVDMAVHQILPAAMHYTRDLCQSLTLKQAVGASCNTESVLVRDLSKHTDSLYDTIHILRHALEEVPKEAEAAAMYYHDTIVPGMRAMRVEADMLEALTDKSYWPYPAYSDLLFY
jgi:glutamine synthetase